MKRSDGSYSYDWSAIMWKRGFPHGPGGSKPLDAATAAAAAAATAADSAPTTTTDEPSVSQGCPVKKHQQQQEYNVYSQPIDPTNQMPGGVANQLPAPQQSKLLSTDRVVSNIPKVCMYVCRHVCMYVAGTNHPSPKAPSHRFWLTLFLFFWSAASFLSNKQGGADEGKTWTYPSPQMFYNALARKGKLGDTKEDDMDNVVAMHNNMNEKTWRKILQWERLAGHDQNVKLLRFQGRPTDLSPKAFFKSTFLGHPLPFDRHDWVILRDDNTTVRYVIDYYFDESLARDTSDSAMPSLHDDTATRSLLVDVRPALDGPYPLYERILAMPLARNVLHTTAFDPLPLFPTSHMKSQVHESVQVWNQIQASAAAKHRKLDENLSSDGNDDNVVTEEHARDLIEKFQTIRSKCRLQEQLLQQCQDDCDKASLNWTMCASPMLCQLQYTSFRDILQGDSEEAIATALTTLSDCVAFQSSRHRVAREKFPHLLQK